MKNLICILAIGVMAMSAGAADQPKTVVGLSYWTGTYQHEAFYGVGTYGGSRTRTEESATNRAVTYSVGIPGWLVQGVYSFFDDRTATIIDGGASTQEKISSSFKFDMNLLKTGTLGKFRYHIGPQYIAYMDERRLTGTGWIYPSTGRNTTNYDLQVGALNIGTGGDLPLGGDSIKTSLLWRASYIGGWYWEDWGSDALVEETGYFGAVDANVGAMFRIGGDFTFDLRYRVQSAQAGEYTQHGPEVGISTRF